MSQRYRGRETFDDNDDDDDGKLFVFQAETTDSEAWEEEAIKT